MQPSPSQFRSIIDTVSEWLRSWTRNPMGFARMGSNPIGVEVLTFYKVFGKLHVHPMEQIRWSNGVTVSTLDFESSDGGSNPPWTYLSHFCHIMHAIFKTKNLRCPGIEPGPSAWKADILTTRPTTQLKRRAS